MCNKSGLMPAADSESGCACSERDSSSSAVAQLTSVKRCSEALTWPRTCEAVEHDASSRFRSRALCSSTAASTRLTAGAAACGGSSRGRFISPCFHAPYLTSVCLAVNVYHSYSRHTEEKFTRVVVPTFFFF